VIDASIQEFLQLGIERQYPSKWKAHEFGGATTIESGGLGILVTHDRENGHLAFASWVLSDVTFSPALVGAVGRLNNHTVLGAYVLAEGQTDHWSITYAIKMRYSWVDQTRTSAYMILDALTALPQFVQRGTEELQPLFGGVSIGVTDGWWFTLMDKF
jgi:hypothetical protein